MSSRLSHVFRLAAKHYATSLNLWLFTAPFFIVGLIFTELSDSWQPESVPSVLMAAVASHLALGFVLWVGEKTLLRPSRRESAGWKQVVPIFVIAGIVRAVTIGIVIEALGVGPANYVTRINTSVVLVVFSFTFFSYSSQLWQDYVSKRSELLNSISIGERTDALRGIAASEYRPLALADLEQDVLNARKQTQAALQAIRQRVRSNEMDPQSVQDIFNASDTNWRNLSHKAWLAGAPNIPKITFSEITKTLVSTKPISLIVLSSGPIYSFTRVFDDLPLPSASLGTLFWLVAILSIGFITNNLASSFKAGGIAVMVCGFAAIQGCAFFISRVLFDSPTSQSEVWYVSLVSSVAAIGLGLPPALEKVGQVVLDQLERRLDAAALENLRAQSEMFVMAQRIGGYLHSEVRGDFLRHSLTLKQALEVRDSVSAEKILDQLDRLIREINLEEPSESPLQNLVTFLNNWNGVIRVSHNLQDVTIKNQHHLNLQAILMEAVNNSVRHGRATWVSVKLSQGIESLHLEIDSDSKPLTEVSVQGLGTKTLNQLAPNRWTVQSLNPAGQDAILRLQVELPERKTNS